MNHPMMKCGHAANSICEGKPSCVICHGIVSGWNEIDESPPDLTDRIAKCGYRDCQKQVPSSPDLAFFEHKPEEEYDNYYCGCKGWN